MQTPDDIWAALGSLSESELFHVITKLYALYEQELRSDPASEPAATFFNRLDTAITQTSQCNSNRR